MKKLIVLFLFLPYWIFAQSNWKPVGTFFPSECQLLDEGTTNTNVSIDISVPGFYVNEVSILEKTYQRLELIGESMRRKRNITCMPDKGRINQENN